MDESEQVFCDNHISNSTFVTVYEISILWKGQRTQIARESDFTKFIYKRLSVSLRCQSTI